MRLPVAALVLILGTSAASAETIVGRASVIDADTLDIHGQRIRLLDIDAPESRQPCFRPDVSEWRCGQEAALALADWIGTRTVKCDTAKLDRYGRHLAYCMVEWVDISVWLASHGWAFPYRNCKCETIRYAVDRAKWAKLGIWSGNVQEPWEWRKSH